MLFADTTIADFAALGQFAAILAFAYGTFIYVSKRDSTESTRIESSEKRYELLVNKVDSTIRETTTKFDTTVREFKAETRDLVDSSMALTEKAVEAIVGFRGGLQELKEAVGQLRREFDGIKKHPPEQKA
jgi:mevalonate kinase